MSDTKIKPAKRIVPLGHKKAKNWPRTTSISEQWQRIAQWRASDDQSPSAELHDAWRHLEEIYGANLIQRGEKLGRLGESPLAALFFLIEMGFYPPPELLLGLQDCWISYLNGSGDISLEKAFLGASRPKAGNAANRNNMTTRKIFMSVKLEEFLRHGLKPIEAAEKVSALVGGAPDADSIVRMFRPRAKSKKNRKNNDRINP